MATQPNTSAGPVKKLPKSTNYDPMPEEIAQPVAPAPAQQAAPLVPVELPRPAMPKAKPVTYGDVRAISPCALGLCNDRTITVTGGPTIGGGVYASPQVVGELSPEAEAWYRRAAERVFGGRQISVPTAASEIAASRVLGLMDNPAYQQRVSDLSPLLGLPAAAAQARADTANELGLTSAYITSPAFGADQQLLNTAQQQAQARAAATGVYDALGVWNDVRPNAQALNPMATPQGVGVWIPNAQGGADVVPTDKLRGVLATPESERKDQLADQAAANKAETEQIRNNYQLMLERYRAAEARIKAARKASEDQRAAANAQAGRERLQKQRDDAAAERDKLKSTAKQSAAPRL